MKYLFCILLISSCCNHHKNRKFTVYMSNGKGWNLSSCHISVDSVTKTTPNSATFWIDGLKTTVYADRILIGN